jgi:hypothetical protein
MREPAVLITESRLLMQKAKWVVGDRAGRGK